jgi:hypothetical protein
MGNFLIFFSAFVKIIALANVQNFWSYETNMMCRYLPVMREFMTMGSVRLAELEDLFTDMKSRVGILNIEIIDHLEKVLHISADVQAMVHLVTMVAPQSF